MTSRSTAPRLRDADTTELVKLVAGMRPGTVIAVAVHRGKDALTLKIKLGAGRPTSARCPPAIPPPPIDPSPTSPARRDLARGRVGSGMPGS